MFSRNIISLIYIFVVAVIATIHNNSHFVTGSDPEVPVYPLTTENPESSTREPGQQVMETLPAGLSSLKEDCEQQLAAQLSVETAVATAILAVERSCASLRQAAISFIRTHILHVMATRGWADAMKSQSEVWAKVMQLLPDPPTETSVPAPADSGATPATQPHSDHSDRGQVLSSAVQPTTSRSTFPSVATVPRLWSMSAEEMGRRLIEAAKKGVVEEVDALLAAGADVEAGTELGWTALDWAAVKGHVEVARRLLAAGAAVDGRKSDSLTTPLHRAAASGQAAMVRLLVGEASADVNARESSGTTPLHWAAYGCKEEAVLALLQAGADKRAKDKQGRTPLDYTRISPFVATC